MSYNKEEAVMGFFSVSRIRRARSSESDARRQGQKAGGDGLFPKERSIVTSSACLR